MKKPEIEIKTECAEGIYNGVFVNGNLLAICHNNHNSDAVRSMIDALVVGYEHVLAICEHNEKLNNGLVLQLDRQDLEQIKQALRKAGCKE